MQHREYVGGDFDRIGKWQYDYVLNYTGVTPDSVFLDIACGCLRLGVHMIPYLHPGNYYGMDSSHSVVQAGIKHEVGEDVIAKYKPCFSVNSDFDFSFCEKYDVAWSNSLLSHLTAADIEKLFTNLKKVSTQDSKFFFTYFDKNYKNIENPDESHPNLDFSYHYSEIEEILRKCGWVCSKLKIQNHPRRQIIVCATIL